MSSLSPIVLFTYNRPWHTQQTVEALQQNHLASESDLFIYSDDWKDEDSEDKVCEVRKYLKGITGFKSIKIIEQSKNKGLANSIIDGVTEIVNKYGRIIVLEDDLVTSPYFLQYMNDGLKEYRWSYQVGCIGCYHYPLNIKFPETFFMDVPNPWSWAT